MKNAYSSQTSSDSESNLPSNGNQRQASHSIGPAANAHLFSLIRMAVSEGLEQVLDSRANMNLKGASPAQANEWLSIEEAAGYLSLAKATVYGLVSQRRIPFFRRGKRLYFRQAELAAWLSETRKETIEEIEQRIRQTDTF